MTATKQIVISFQIFAVLTILSFILLTECLLTGEIARFFAGLGKDENSALAWAWVFALLIPILCAAPRSAWIWVSGLRAVFIAALIVMNIWFASQSAIAPVMKETISESDRKVISEYEKQLAAYDRQADALQKQAESLPTDHLTRRREILDRKTRLLENRAIVLTELRTVSEKKPDNGRLADIIANTTVLTLLFSRMALEIGILFLSLILKKTVLSIAGQFRAEMQTAEKPEPEPAAAPAPEPAKTADTKQNFHIVKAFDNVENTEKNHFVDVSRMVPEKPEKADFDKAEKAILDFLANSENRAKTRKALTESRTVRTACRTSETIDVTAENLVSKGILECVLAEKKADIVYRLRNGYGMKLNAHANH